MASFPRNDDKGGRMVLRSKNRAFTIVEVLIAFSIFMMVMGIVTFLVMNSFNSLQRAQKIFLREHKQRLCMYRLNREVSSLTRIDYPHTGFKGEEKSFFLYSPGRMIW